MSTAPVPRRYALGLPAGSVRATHLLAVSLILALLLVIPGRGGDYMAFPPYLVYLLFLMIGSYFAARGSHVAGTHAPLYLPRGLIRLLVLGGLGAAVAYRLYFDPDTLRGQFERSLEEMKKEPMLPLYLLVGFVVGSLIRSVIGRDNPTRWLQDVEAWLSILGLVGLGISTIIHLIINPSLETPISIPRWDQIMATLVAFYFGARS